MVGADLQAPVELAGAGRRDHVAPVQLCNLNSEHAHAGPAAHYEDGLAGPHTGAPDEHVPGRGHRHRGGRGLVVPDPVGYRDGVVLGQVRKLAVPAPQGPRLEPPHEPPAAVVLAAGRAHAAHAARQVAVRDDAVARPHGRHAVADLDYVAGRVGSRHVRHRHADGLAAHPPDVVVVEGRGAHAEDDLAGARTGGVDVPHRQDRRKVVVLGVPVVHEGPHGRGRPAKRL